MTGGGARSATAEAHRATGNPPPCRAVLSGYLAYRAARAQAQGQLRDQLDDLARRVEMEVPRL
ncbi:hypothetical protein Ari01nite_01310 [Paractinoplanes rishiriensis]|uniref:Uncharacterized protein n=1 Tax=Paractinoplanes rishiriensis TaxID=1050105 RepID=A0A919JXA9_9ACTN|nr:hypothetical protein Ari01nite_01310 [Actinoplanes rishiriensis]